MGHQVGSRELALWAPGKGPLAYPVPFSFRSSPMEMQPSVSPQQSECNPVGALQVCPASSALEARP